MTTDYRGLGGGEIRTRGADTGATEHTPANGALTLIEAFNEYWNQMKDEGYSEGARKIALAAFTHAYGVANRPASYTLEQIRAVVQDEGFARISWQGVGAQKSFANAVCNRLTAPKPKTAEERVTVVAGTGGYFDAKVVSALVAALKEREAHNG
jgi:hypothetical protein